MITVEKSGIVAEEVKRRTANGEIVSDMSYKEWENWKKGLENPGESSILHLDDIEIGRSVGSKAKNYEILDLETGEYFHFAEGTKIQNVEVFAGKGTKKPLGIAEKYANRHGGKPEDWQHVKGHAIIATDD